MSDYPEKIYIDDKEFFFEKIFRDDTFSMHILYKNSLDDQKYVLKISDFRFAGGWLLRPIAALMSKIEYHLYQKVADIEGIPRLGPRYGRRGYFHLFIAGRTLDELGMDNHILPADFFDQLRRSIDQIHQRAILYVDLNKRSNIIVSEDKKAYLIDYQTCLSFPRKILKDPSELGYLHRKLRQIFETLKREDLYYLYKHKKIFAKKYITEEELALTQRSLYNKLYSRWIGTPYKTIKRFFLPKR